MPQREETKTERKKKVIPKRNIYPGGKKCLAGVECMLSKEDAAFFKREGCLEG